MIIEFSIENFLSIRDKVVLSLESSAAKKHPQNLIDSESNGKILKTAAIYGANASGKSNIIKSMNFFWFMVKQSHNFNVDQKIPRVPFKFDNKTLKKPSSFELLFIHKGIKYKYGFSCDNEKIKKEYLFHWPHGRVATIFNRENTKKFVVTTDEKKQKIIQNQTNDNVLYLSRATQLGYEKTREAYEFIVNNIIINYQPHWPDFTLKQIHENPKTKKKIIEILQKTDFGGIENIRIKKEKKKEKGVEIQFKEGNVTFNEMGERERDHYDLRLIHRNSKGEDVELNINEESEGTKKALFMLGPLFEILESGKTAFIDEFESSLHPDITRFFIRLFHTKNNKDSQLVFTTHDTNLLDNEIFRRDQIYICSKKPNENTELSSLVDYNLRESIDFERAYLTGRVGGLPFIDDSILE